MTSHLEKNKVGIAENANDESVEEAVFKYVGEGLNRKDEKSDKRSDDPAAADSQDDNVKSKTLEGNSAEQHGGGGSHGLDSDTHAASSDSATHPASNGTTGSDGNAASGEDNSSDMSWYIRHEEDLPGNTAYMNENDAHLNPQSNSVQESVALAAVVAAYAADKKRKLDGGDHIDSIDGEADDMHSGRSSSNSNSHKRSKMEQEQQKKDKLQLAVDPELATLDDPSPSSAQDHLVRKAIIDTDSIAQNPDFQQYLNTEAEPVKTKHLPRNNQDSADAPPEIQSPGKLAVTLQSATKQYSELARESLAKDSSGLGSHGSPLSEGHGDTDEDTKLLQSAANRASEIIGTTSQTSGKAFDANEETALDQFIEEYRNIKKFTRKQTCERIWTNGRRKDDFWINICKVLPYRTRSSIYKHVRRRYHIFDQRGKWTQDEDAELAKLCAEKEGQWSEVGKALGRMPEDCRDRWRNYIKCGSNRAANKWSETEEALLKKVISDMVEEAKIYQDRVDNGLISAEVEDEQKAFRGPRGKKMSGKPNFKDVINWTVVSERMGGTRSRIQCRYKWNKLVRKQAISKIEKVRGDDKRWIVGKLRDLGFTDDSQVDWEELATLKPGSKWSGLELKLCYEKMRTMVKFYKERSISEIAKSLLDMFDNELELEKEE
ncbi:Nsi1p KNAG_0H01320 [Huiozyma naganishii CBS 8797]|uniref:DNA-binding protein REB1 n=1 Tax=Huiozyma naganishii (strain ATCC MYA-139 / BCRC 22969 / CBS 8797 / KCTC 17520 / NBRC 10181 / NCYC 3082 / Yp74L-3) TaxID=1071383 RepID=J7R9L3_HUIN7|nr:hypothetical protein KNAG_0H01320 [Kazachstania naganishii CBS 8797]CCK71545.1 hypothetical protein KNAG_0H01320 [Kazachstania naganishii CBS 8797]